MEQIDYSQPERQFIPVKDVTNAYTKIQLPKLCYAIEDHLLLHTTWNNGTPSNTTYIAIHQRTDWSTLSFCIRMTYLTSTMRKYYAYNDATKYQETLTNYYYDNPVITCKPGR